MHDGQALPKCGHVTRSRNRQHPDPPLLMSSHEGSGIRHREPLRRSTVRYGPGFKPALPASAAPTDRHESIAGSGTWPGSASSRPVVPMSACSRYFGPGGRIVAVRSREVSMMPDAGMRRVTLPDATLEVDVRGSGEPVVLIQTALIADEFEPSPANRHFETTTRLSCTTGGDTRAAARLRGRDPSPATSSTASGY